nr:MAG TPA: hypothetical protein [Bacteriophage sp.]
MRHRSAQRFPNPNPPTCLSVSRLRVAGCRSSAQQRP